MKHQADLTQERTFQDTQVLLYSDMRTMLKINAVSNKTYAWILLYFFVLFISYFQMDVCVIHWYFSEICLELVQSYICHVPVTSLWMIGVSFISAKTKKWYNKTKGRFRCWLAFCIVRQNWFLVGIQKLIPIEEKDMCIWHNLISWVCGSAIQLALESSSMMLI